MAECTLCGGAGCGHKLCMNKVPIFSSLEGADLAKIAPLIGHRVFQKGGLLYREGEQFDSLVILNEGSVKGYKIAPDGREQILYVFSQGDFFGERNLFGGKAAAFTAEALEPVKTCTLSRDNFKELLRRYPEISVKIIEELEERMERLENTLQTIGVRSVDARIAALLLDYACKYGSQSPQGITIRLPLSREGMANFLGIARETVSRKLGQLESDGVIRSLSGKNMLLLDSSALELMAGKTE